MLSALLMRRLRRENPDLAAQLENDPEMRRAAAAKALELVGDDADESDDRRFLERLVAALPAILAFIKELADVLKGLFPTT